MPSICIFGDSLSWGAWDFEQGGWGNRLRKYIESKHGIKYLVYNLGISGDTTHRLLERLKIELQAAKPEIVIISEGINDSLFYKDTGKNCVDINDFQNNLTKILTTIKKFTNKIIFIGLTKVEESKVNPFSGKTGKECYNNTNIKKYDKSIQKFCLKNKLYYVNVFDLLDNNDFIDGIHPNSMGHKKLFEQIINYFESNKLI